MCIENYVINTNKENKKEGNKMTTKEMCEAKVKEYKLLRKRALEVEDYFLAEYYDGLIKDAESEMKGV
jgi:hypothetical protein